MKDLSSYRSQLHRLRKNMIRSRLKSKNIEQSTVCLRMVLRYKKLVLLKISQQISQQMLQKNLYQVVKRRERTKRIRIRTKILALQPQLKMMLRTMMTTKKKKLKKQSLVLVE